MNHINVSRRRFIGIVASTSAFAAVPAAWRMAQASEMPAPITWQGIALGADAQLQIYHPDRTWAQQLIERAIVEVHRLENVFSLYQTDSALVRLNRDGQLHNAPSDLLRLLEESRGYSHMTMGAFDPTVQALWQLYADTIRAGNTEPTPDALSQALQRVDYRAIEIDGRRISLGRRGMALTLNGIAQGYITDRITEMLRDAGLEHAMVNMGEIRGLTLNPADRPWRVGLADDSEERTVLETVEVRNLAISTSSGQGTVLDQEGKITHLFDPRTGGAMPNYRGISVEAGTATKADALSTAFSVMEEESIRRIATEAGVRTWVLHKGTSAYTLIT